MMVFIDGENLVARYQAMIDEGWRAGRNGVIRERDIFVWEATSVVTGLNAA